MPNTLAEQSLLPKNLSQLERDLAGALARISEIDIPIKTLWNARTCPTELLPYLAWAMRVDSWQTSWTEQQKRNVIFQAVDVNRLRGTRGAVERAISAIRGDDVKVTEWFEDEAKLKRGEFRIDVKSTNTPVDIAELNKLVPDINAAKNARSHLNGISITSQIQNPEKRISIGRQATVVRSGAWIISSVVGNAIPKSGVVSRMAIVIRSGALPLHS